jgi:hypothetical protein
MKCFSTFFCYIFRYIIFLYSGKNVLNHIIVYVYCVNLLIWSPTQLDFPFYDFSVIYYKLPNCFKVI